MKYLFGLFTFVAATSAQAIEWQVFGDRTSCTARGLSKWGIRASLYRELGSSSVSLHLSEDDLADNLTPLSPTDVDLVLTDKGGSIVGGYTQRAQLVRSSSVAPTIIFRTTPGFLAQFKQAAGMRVMKGSVMLFGIELEGCSKAVGRFQKCWDSITGYRRF